MQQKHPIEREFYTSTILPEETRNLNRQPNFTPKTTGKITKKNKNKISRRKKIIIAEINENEMNETIVKINKTKS